MLKRYIEYVQFQGISTMSKIIQKWTRDKDSHSAVLDRERMGPDQLIEQWPHDGGFKSWMDYNEFGPSGGHTIGTPYLIYSLEVSSAAYDFIMGKYRESAAAKKPYDWSGIKDFGFHGDGDPDKTFCSEEMCMQLREWMILDGHEEWEAINPVTVHPGYWRNILIAAGAKQTIGGVI
jgi:hypothetical protein